MQLEEEDDEEEEDEEDWELADAYDAFDVPPQVDANLVISLADGIFNTLDFSMESFMKSTATPATHLEIQLCLSEECGSEILPELLIVQPVLLLLTLLCK